MMMLGFLSFLFFAVGLALAFWLWILPLLKARPAFAEFYARTDSFWAALVLKINTIKTKLAAILLMAGSALIQVHDFLLPVATGIDWTPVTSLLPAWGWTLVSFGLGALFYWLRTLTQKEQAGRSA